MANTIEFIDEFFGLLKSAYDMEFKPGQDRREAFAFASAQFEKGEDITDAVEAFVEAFGKTLDAASLESHQAAEDLEAAPKDEDDADKVEAREDAKANRAPKAKKKAKKKVAKKAAAKKAAKKAAAKKKVVKKKAKGKAKATGTRGPSKAMQAYHAFIEWGEGDHDAAVTKAEADKEAAITAIQEALDTNRNNAGTYLSRFRRNDLPAK
jgi:hypothetical protein